MASTIFQAERPRFAHREAADRVPVGIEIQPARRRIRGADRGTWSPARSGTGRARVGHLRDPPHGNDRRPGRAQRTVRCMLWRAYSWLTGYSGHSSSTIRMSLPKASCTSTVDSGVNVWRIAVEVRLEDHALLGDLAQAAQAEDLKAAGIGEDGVRPGHEAVQSAHLADQLVPGPQIQMIGVGQQDLRRRDLRRDRAG